MIVTQRDIAHMPDDVLKAMAVGIVAGIEDDPEPDGPAAELMQGFAEALIRAVQERRRTLLIVEADMLNDEIEEGEIIHDSSADADVTP